MPELWIGAIAATIAGCIWAAWGPKVLLGTIMTPIVIGAVLFSMTLHEQSAAQKATQSTHLEFDDLIPKKPNAVPAFNPDVYLKGVYDLPAGYTLDKPKDPRR